jgi:uncharacterized BrkB/YihY/UPF0761 family membrane protein
MKCISFLFCLIHYVLTHLHIQMTAEKTEALERDTGERSHVKRQKFLVTASVSSFLTCLIYMFYPNRFLFNYILAKHNLEKVKKVIIN